MKPDDILAHPAKVLTSAQRGNRAGHPARAAHLDATPCPVPPDWGKVGYGSIFSVQRIEEAN